MNAAAFASPAPLVSPWSRSRFLPKEHGSWSLAFEPLALGLAVAPSPVGIALAVAAAAVFFARRPLKGFALARPGQRWPHALVSALLLLLAFLGLIEAAALGGCRPLWPLLIALPFGAAFARFDHGNDGRAAFAELAGCITFSLLPAALVLLAGQPLHVAFGATLLMTARSVTTVLTVRNTLRRRGDARSASAPVWLGTVASLVLLLLSLHHRLPPLAPVFGFALLIRTVVLALAVPCTFTARQLGIGECVLGVVYVAGATALLRLW